MFYAQIDNNNICVGVSHLAGSIDLDNYIEIDSYNTELLGAKYLGNNEWEYQKLSVELIEPTIEEEILFETKYQTILLEMGV